METKDMISQFIQKERSSTRQLHLNGVYSLEFALGLLAGLNNLAGFYGLRSVTEDIRGDIEYLGAMNPVGDDRSTPDFNNNLNTTRYRM